MLGPFSRMIYHLKIQIRWGQILLSFWYQLFIWATILNIPRQLCCYGMHQVLVGIYDYVSMNRHKTLVTPFLKHWSYSSLMPSLWYVSRLVQGRRNSIANALEFRLSCTNLSVNVGQNIISSDFHFELLTDLWFVSMATSDVVGLACILISWCSSLPGVSQAAPATPRGHAAFYTIIFELSNKIEWIMTGLVLPWCMQ